MQLFDGKNQVPVFAPNNVPVLNGETVELARVEVFVVLRMGMATNEIANIHRLHSVVAERQANGQIACVFGFDHENLIHIVFSLQFLLDIRTANALLQNEEFHPLVDDVFVIFSDESLSGSLLLFRQ